MQLPYRKPGKYSEFQEDPLLTQEKYNELARELETLRTIKRPKAAAEVSRLGEFGDFSENAEYQLAKGRLRGINNAILKLEVQLNRAVIIPEGKQDGVVRLGTTVTVRTEGIKHTYQILGSSETKPDSGVISYTSPIGSALMGARVGETVTVHLQKKDVVYVIESIS